MESTNILNQDNANELVSRLFHEAGLRNNDVPAISDDWCLTDGNHSELAARTEKALITQCQEWIQNISA